MITPKALVLRAAGTSGDSETEFALKQAGFDVRREHVSQVMDAPAMLADVQLLVIPGGAAYGDDIAAGKILANQVIRRLADALNRFVQADKLVLGISNGFQVMVKSGLLPWGNIQADQAGQDVTLAWNSGGRFENRWVRLRCDSGKCAFLGKGDIVTLPVAHAEGRFVPRDATVLDRLRSADQIALRYIDAAGNDAKGSAPANPSGSIDDIAGLCDPTGRILGLMPQPERFTEITHHPQWTRGGITRADGKLLFDNARKYFA